MTHLEAKELLKNRVEWKQPSDPIFNFLVFGTPESGRFLQEEHSAVNIPLMYETIVEPDITNQDFQATLQEIKEQSILQMLHDVFFDRKDIENSVITGNLFLFDYAIILKNTNNVLSKIRNTTRINATSKITEENLRSWFFDLYGVNDRENGVFVQGSVKRYEREVVKIRAYLHMRSNLLTVVTAT